MAHRKELIEQAAQSIGLHLDEGCGVEMGQLSDARRGRLVDRSKVVVASVQTLSRPTRLQGFRPNEFGLVITDEAHHGTSDSYRTVYGWFQQNRQCRFLGITATPDRSDEVMLGEIFETTAYKKDICEGIDDGWLVPVVQKFVYVKGLDFSSCRTTAGDVNAKDLERAMSGEFDAEDEEARIEHEKMLHAVADPAIREANGRPGIVFCVTVRHSDDMAMMLRRHGCTAESVTQETDSDTRTEIIRDFKAGRLQWLVGVGVFTEGFDAPNAEIIVNARPTKSRALYTQMVGRGTRPLMSAIRGIDDPEERKRRIAASAKPNCTVWDFVGNCGRHKLICTADILGDAYPEDLREAVLRRLRSLSESFDIREEMAQEQARREEMQRLKAEQEKAERERAAKKAEELRERIRREAELRGHKATAQYSTEEIDPFGDGAQYQRGVDGPRRGSCSDKQVEYLVALGVSRDKAMGFDKRQAGAVIDSLMAKSGGEYRITFGKHKGKSLANAGPGFVWWVENQMERGPKRESLMAQIELMNCERKAVGQ
jgi:superfamily II DNA or RNA helicase